MNIDSTLWLLAHSDEPEDRREWCVLYWKYNGLKHREIAEKFHYTSYWVQRYMTSAYKRFDAPTNLNHLEKFEWLQENVFPALKKFLEDNPDTLKGLPLPPPPPEEPSEGKDSEIDTDIKTYVSKPMIIKDRRTSPWRACLVLTAFGLLTVVVGFAAYRLGVNSESSTSTKPVEAIPTERSSPTSETGVPVVSSSDTPVLPSDTPLPSPTPTPSPTATNTPTPTKAVLFFDDFNEGLDPAWEIISGYPVIVNGRLGATELTILAIGDPSWTNYEIEFDAELPSYGYTCLPGAESNALSVRSADIDNRLQFSFTNCGAMWFFIRSGEGTEIPGTRSGDMSEAPDLLFSIASNQFTVHNGAKLLSNFRTDEYPSGYVYLRIRRDHWFDNFTIAPISP